MYDDICVEKFLEHQLQLFPEPVAETEEEALYFLEDVCAVVCDSKKDVINYKTYVVLAYQKCNANDKIVKFLEEYKPNVISADLGALLVKTYKKNSKYEDAYNMLIIVFPICAVYF